MSSIRITCSEAVSEILMSKRRYIIFEGNIDKKLWESYLKNHPDNFLYLSANSVKSDYSNNKMIVVNIMKCLNKSKHTSFGVIDLDYDDVLGIKIIEDNLYYYKGQSLEIYLLNSVYFEEVLNLISNMDFESDKIKKIRKAIYAISRNKGIIRILNKNGCLGKEYSCNNVKIEKFYNKKDFMPASIETIFGSLQGVWSLTNEQVNKLEMRFKEYEKEEDEYICHGHDTFEVLEKMVGSKLIPTPNKEKYTGQQILNYFISYHDSKAKNTNIPDDILGTILQ